MLITAVAFTGTAGMRENWLVCTQYMVGPLIVVSDDSWHVRNGTSSDGNSSHEVFLCFHYGFIHQLIHVPPEEEIHIREVKWPGVWKRCRNRRRLVARINVAVGITADMPGIFERTRHSILRGCTACIQGSRIRAVPVNSTAVISMLNYLLCKSSLASEVAVKDHMYLGLPYLET